MGNNYDLNQNTFYMHLKFIGLNMERFLNKLKNSITLESIIKFWNIDSLQNTDSSEQINDYFDKLQIIDQNNEDITLRECLIVKVNNTFVPEVNSIIEKMNKLSSGQYMPLVLILTSEYSNKKIVIDTEKYDQIDPRLFFIENYTEDQNIIEENIVPILLRFCSIHNELGDVFSLNKSKKEEEKFDLIKTAFPFNLNIVCIGRFGQGKSTGINQILQEYKAKESNKGCSQKKNITYYQVKNKPIRIFEIPGFESEETIKIAIDKFKNYHEKLYKLKDNIHIILYFLNFTEKRTFMELEYPILEEISQHESAQIIYVITHSKSKNPKNKNKIYDRINSGIQDVTRNKRIFSKIKMFKATEDNVVFVNFHYDKDLDIEPFGKQELFKKIYDFFIKSKDYKNYLKKLLTKEEIEKTALKLRAEAKSILLPNKVWGAAVGIIPFVDIALQKFVIKKNAVKKVGEIFGIDAKFIDEDNEKEKKLKKNENNIYFTTPGLTDNGHNSYIKANDLTKESNKYIVGKAGQCSTEYSGGISASGYAINALSKSEQLTVESAQYNAQAAKLIQEANNISGFAKSGNFVLGKGSTIATEASNLSAKAISTEASPPAAGALGKFIGVGLFGVGFAKLCNFVSGIGIINLSFKAISTKAPAAEAISAGILGNIGVGLFGVGMVVGVGVGAYTTHKFCEEILDKFVEYYKKNVGELQNSYKESAEYFL